MNRKKKRIIVSTTAVGLAGIITAGALLHTSVAVQASSAMMPGIETIVNTTTKEEPLNILEIVDSKNEAEIGYYVSGQEPFLKLYTYDTGEKDADEKPIIRTFSSIEEALSVLPEDLRKAFVENTNLNQDGTPAIKDIRNLCGPDILANPLSFEEYQERYFLSAGEAQDSAWKKVDFENGEVRTVEVRGHYEQVNPGEGDYTKEEVNFYPVREDISSDKAKAKYRENIQGFANAGEGMSASPYHVTFTPLKNTETEEYPTTFSPEGVNQDYDYGNERYGYYINVYRELNEKTDFDTFPGEKDFIGVSAAEEAESQVLESADAFSDSLVLGDSANFETFGAGEFSDEIQANAQENNPMIYRARRIQEYPNYQYIEFKSLKEVQQEAIRLPEDGTLPEIPEEKPIITLDPKTGDYKLWVRTDFETYESEYLYYIQSRQQVEKNNVRNLPEKYYGEPFADADIPQETIVPYYYRVEDHKLSCSFKESEGINTGNADEHPEAYKYTGWYYGFTPSNEDVYIETTPEKATHYSSEDEYKFTPGAGDYKFVPNSDEELVKVQTNHLYYQGGYTNHDWLKRFVFHLSPEDPDPEVQQQFADFGIRVDSVTKEEFNGEYDTSAAVAASTHTFQSEAPEGLGADEMENLDAFSDDGADEAAWGEEALGDKAAIGVWENSGLEDFSETDEAAQAESLDEGIQTEVEPMISESMGELGAGDGFVSDSFQEESLEGEQLSDGESGDSEPDNTEGFTDQSDVAEEFSADDAQNTFKAPAAEEGSLQLSDYDLIYINASLSAEQAGLLAGLGIPTIINQDKAGENSGIKTAFADFIKDDADGHFVSRYVYFFSEAAEAKVSELVNQEFHTAFGGEGFTDDVSAANMLGFEEIAEYIASENQYRKLAGKADEELLDGGISQARVIEYILNYKHQRQVVTKDTINVLDIEPAVSGQYLTPQDVEKWMGGEAPKINKADACCYNLTPSEGIAAPASPQNMIDGNRNTYWLASFTTGDNNIEPEMHHWTTDKATRSHEIMLELDAPSSLVGFVYCPPLPGVSFYGNSGVLKQFKITLLDEENRELYSEDGSFTYAGNDDRSAKTHYFQNRIEDVKFIKINATEYNGTQYEGWVSCAEIGVLDRKVNITSMTTSEFAGHIEDLNTNYDLIYFGAGGRQNSASYPGLANLINGSGDMLYSHVGGLTEGLDKWMGLLNQGSAGEEEFRGSGNDITQQQVDALTEYVKSGYPLVISSALLKDGAIDTGKVDNSSYVYDFLADVYQKNNYQNVYTSDAADKGQFSFFLNLPKPTIQFTQGGEPLSAIGSAEGPSGNYITTGELRYQFSIQDEAETSLVNSSYNCELFVDLNSDGNFSDTERLDDIQIRDMAGNALQKGEDGRFALRLKTVYTVTRRLPEEYAKLLTWKIRVSNNARPYVRTEIKGYSKQRPDAENLPDIEVLQIYQNPIYTDYRSPRWILTDDTYSPYYDQEFNDMLRTVAANEFDIHITTMSIKDYVEAYKKEYEGNSKNLLDQYDMLIIGFSDMYDNIENLVPNTTIVNDKNETVAPPGAVDAILNFIEDKKSVLFAHDTTSFNNNDNNPSAWGYSFNSILRPVIGLDRYGITNTSIKDILRQGLELQSATANWNPVWDNQFYLKGDRLHSDGDMAFQAGSEKSRTYAQTQGFTNSLLIKDAYLGSDVVNNAVKVNEGAITEYPFKIPDSIAVANTHGQYYQLALEEDQDRDGLNDIIVWYCLNGNIYGQSPKDVRNNYYLYSKGNVMYTGVGHSDVNITGNRMEKALFVNAIVASYRASVINPRIRFVKDFSRDAGDLDVDFYSMDQYAAMVGNERNIIDSGKEFYFTVDDYNLIATNNFTDNQRSLNLELYIDDPNGKDASVYKLDGVTEKVSPLAVQVFQNDWSHGLAEGVSTTHKVNSGNVYGFSIENIEQYIKDANGTYRNNVNIYAKVSTEFTLYGRQTSGEAMDSIMLKQRQLFDMD